MKKRLEFSVFLLTIIFSSVSMIYRVIPTAKATYVEGVIARDTDWTLVDSPIVLSGNVYVSPGVTLTIEPAAEVRFGEGFSLILGGSIVADGKADKLISFTSNKISPSNGDWGSLLFNGTGQSSLSHCRIEYGTSGITFEDGLLNIQESRVKSNSENGIKIDSGIITVKNNEISNNTVCGIYIDGGSQVVVEDNDILSNGNGIALVGHLTGELNIKHNDVSLNGQSGITLEADAYDNTVIIENSVSSNFHGFHVSDSTSTYITGNFISNNTIGIYYESGGNHEAHFNDIYENVVGMDVASTANVSATYNYWGDKNGPFHESLNPYGKGNRVGGDGINLDFIFFLSATSEHINAIPTAVLWTDKASAALDQNVTFIGIDSYDEGRVDQYFFDFGDGTNTGWITLSLFNHTYSSIGTYIASLNVIDDFNATSENLATTTITVQDLASLTVSMTLSNETVNNNGNTTVNVHASNEFGNVENANVTLFSLRGGYFSPVSGLTDSTGHFATVFTAPNVTDISNLRLIARASIAGYADGSDHAYLKVLPPLTIQMTPEQATVKSEETADIILKVTDGLGQPVADVLLTLQCDNGSLSPNTGFTDSNGDAIFNFTAPYTLTEANVIVTVTAAKSGFTDGQIHREILVEPKVLVVEVTADPSSIVSESTSNITAIITSDGQTISDATVKVSTDGAGNFTSTSENTDSNGISTFFFNAAQTTTELNAAVTVTATKDGYVDGKAQAVIVIRPKMLTVEVTAEPLTMVSEANSTVTVRVTYDATPVQDVNVTIASESGAIFYQPNKLTSIWGIADFTLTADQVNTPMNVTITAYASKTGYVDGQNSFKISINPGILDAQVKASLPSIMSGNSVVVQVHVTANATPISDAHVIISTNAGNFSATSAFTDSNGNCTFIFNAPQTTAQLSAILVVNVNKNGYVGSQNQTEIDIIPEEIASESGGGLPLIAILLMAIIPIVIAVVVVALIRLKIIVISTGEEGE